MTDEERFAAVFRENVRRRSRTAKGQDKGSETSSSKKPLALQGEALAAKVAENTEALIADVAARGHWRQPVPRTLDAATLRSNCERWFDLVNDGLYGPGAYGVEFDALEADALRLGAMLGTRLDVNRRYRLWTPQYTTMRVAPVLLETVMDGFYDDLLARIECDLACDGHDRSVRAAAAMAYADGMMDGEVHPWMDGCGRVCTALVMWLSDLYRVPPPLFAETKDGHYAAIRDFDAHFAYFVRAIRRGESGTF